jgi:N-acetyl sugar amidotransferase
MKYCKRCLYPENHPLNLTFDNEGVCSGCRVHEEKDEIDWPERKEKLRSLLNEFKSRSRSLHDCIIPVSGGRDSHFIVHTIKHEFGMHPLLVNYNKHYNTRMGIRNLAYLQSLLGCDIFTQTASPALVKKVTRESLRQLGSMYWHCLAGATVFPVQIAVKFKIPLIIWGAHQGNDQVGMYSHLDEVEMTRKYRKDHDLMGMEAEDLVRNSEELTLADMEPFLYPHDNEIRSVGVRGIYLNNYIRWDSKAQHEKMIELYGYETSAQQRTFDTYNDVDSFHYSGIHDTIKFLKWGYGKVSDHASREIRLKRLTREEGTALVRQYQDKKPEDLALFLKWAKISEEQFWAWIDNHRDPRAWQKDAAGQWQLLDSIIHHEKDEGVDAVRLQKQSPCDFQLNPPRVAVDEDKYILIGRGWVDHPE